MVLNLSRITGIDFNVAATLLFRSWSIIAGGLLLLLIPIYLSSEEQGYYFTFSSIIAAQVFFELGLNYVIVQMIGHEMAGLNFSKKYGLSGEENNLVRVFHLISLLKKWYLYISIAFFIIIFSVGYIFFITQGTLPSQKWFSAWLLLSFSSALNLFISPFLSVLEGFGLVGKVAMIRLIQSIVGYTLLFLSIMFGFGLNAIPALSLSTAVISISWMLIKYRNIFFHRKNNSNSFISWRKDIFPFQWRIAVSWLSGYFIFQLFNPVIFSSQGAIEAGKIGLTLTIFTTMLSLSMSWVSAKTPIMARYVALNDRKELNVVFKDVIYKSGAANLIIMLTFFSAIKCMEILNIPLVTRLADLNIIVMLIFVAIANHIIFCAAAYMRAHKEEPMMLNSLVTGVLNAIGIVVFSKVSSFAVIASYMGVILIICLPWTLYLFHRYYIRA